MIDKDIDSLKDFENEIYQMYFEGRLKRIIASKILGVTSTSLTQRKHKYLRYKKEESEK